MGDRSNKSTKQQSNKARKQGSNEVQTTSWHLTEEMIGFRLRTEEMAIQGVTRDVTQHITQNGDQSS